MVGVRMYLAWLADGTGSGASRRRFRGDPLTNPTARDWAIRDCRLYLLREATPKRSVATATRLGPRLADS